MLWSDIIHNNSIFVCTATCQTPTQNNLALLPENREVIIRKCYGYKSALFNIHYTIFGLWR